MPTIVEALKMRYPNAKGSTIVDVLKSINGAEVGDDIDDHILNGKGKPNFYYDPPWIMRDVFAPEAPSGGFEFTRFEVTYGDEFLGYGYKYEFDSETDVSNPPVQGEVAFFTYTTPDEYGAVQQTGRFCTNDGLTRKDKIDGTKSEKPLMILGGASPSSVKTAYLFLPETTEETVNLTFAYAVLTPLTEGGEPLL